MRALCKLPALLCVIVLTTAWPLAAAGSPSGVRQFTTASKERGRDIMVTVWYPAGPGGKNVTLGESPLFMGTEAMLNAPIAEGQYPVVLLSHGAGLAGTPEAMSWIAVPLAKQGYVVAAPLHLGNGGIDRSATETIKLWLRPPDISATLDALQGQPFLENHLQLGSVGVLGLSMGGSTALSLAGARIDPSRLANYCDNLATNPSLCGWMKQSGVDLHQMDVTSAGRDNRDGRITFAMAIDPAPVDVFEMASFQEISIPVEIINLGQPDEIPSTALASGVAAAIPAGRYAILTDANHFSMFGVCKPDAPTLAKADGIEEPICSDGSGHTRTKVHQELIKATSEALHKWLR